MNIFENIVNKIFKHESAHADATTQQVPNSPLANPQASTAQPVTQAAPVNVEQILTKMASENSQKLSWQTSIVDLLKLLGLDSSLTARKQLAQELKYHGDLNDTAKMNTWLSQQVMMKLANNGGKVPADLH